jgi:hypothetical protein
MNIARILCPTDFSDASAHAVGLATMIFPSSRELRSLNIAVTARRWR